MSVFVFRVFLRSLLELLVIQHFADIFDDKSFSCDINVRFDTETFDFGVENTAVGVVVSLELLVVAELWR